MRIDAEARAALDDLLKTWDLAAAKKAGDCCHRLAARDLRDRLSRMEVEPEPVRAVVERLGVADKIKADASEIERVSR
jgi:hypothetical protein